MVLLDGLSQKVLCGSIVLSVFVPRLPLWSENGMGQLRRARSDTSGIQQSCSGIWVVHASMWPRRRASRTL